MGTIFSRRKKPAGLDRRATSADTEHLYGFVAAHPGVEAFVEPRTTVTETTVLLVAGDGEWTRRRVDGTRGAAEFARRAKVPIYEVAVVGYPQRMRDWNARRRSAAAD